MNHCYNEREHDSYRCVARSECADRCRAGWLPAPVPCDVCTQLTRGPFLSVVHDDGDQDVFYRLVCPECAYRLERLPAAGKRGSLGVMWMTDVPVKEQ